MAEERDALTGLPLSWWESWLLQKQEGKDWGAPREEWGDQKADHSLLAGKAQIPTHEGQI